jgi:hypothetical protein
VRVLEPLRYSVGYLFESRSVEWLWFLVWGFCPSSWRSCLRQAGVGTVAWKRKPSQLVGERASKPVVSCGKRHKAVGSKGKLVVWASMVCASLDGCG